MSDMGTEKKEQEYPVSEVNCPHPKGTWSVLPKTEERWEEEGTLSMICQDCGKAFEGEIKWGGGPTRSGDYRRAGFKVISGIDPK